MAQRPERVVCLTAETTEIAFALGCGERIVGVTGFAERPAEARTKPRVVAFQTGDVDRILELRPDLVLAFSDVQAELVGELVRRGAQVLATNQRTLDETYGAMALIAGALGEPARGEQLIAEMRRDLDAIRAQNEQLSWRPKVYFEEWNEPLIAGITWVSELIELAGGEDTFPELRTQRSASGRVLSPDEVVRRAPDIIVASWCGKKAHLDQIAARPGWDAIPAVRNGALYELPAADILQPGPSLVHGARQFAAWIRAAASDTVS